MGRTDAGEVIPTSLQLLTMQQHGKSSNGGRSIIPFRTYVNPFSCVLARQETTPPPLPRQSPCPRHDHTLFKGNTCLRNRTYDTAPPRHRCRSQVLDVVPPVSRHSPTPKSVSQSVSVRPPLPPRPVSTHSGQLQPSTRRLTVGGAFQISFNQIATRSSRHGVRVGNLWYCFDKVVPRGEDI